mmetsp:Transcript_102543/g.265165  ORF Transcript_102543/g.265165 Transcript_102543/m.265165 type:complete len:433 (-) Transcript_102543:282-1580(-)
MVVRTQRALLCALGLAFVRPSSATVESSVVRLGGPEEQHRWQYLGKFGYGIGVGTYDLRLRLRNPLPEGASPMRVDLDVFLDEDWHRVEPLAACRRSQEARQTHRMVELSRHGGWGPWVGGELAQSVRPHLWYFALSGCGLQGALEARDIEFELVMRQADHSHLSIEQRWMPAATILALLSLSAFLARFMVNCRQFRRSVGIVHPVIKTLAAAVVLQWVAQVLHLVHFSGFRADGQGIAVAEAAAEVLFMMSQVVISTLLIVIASGYTLNTARTDGMGMVRPAAAAIAIVHILLVCNSQLSADTSDKHHENGGYVGWMLLVSRLALYGWFVSLVRQHSQKGGYRLQLFLQRFQTAGSMYFLAYPALFLLTQVFAPYLRHPIMQIGLALMQTASAFWLSDLFLSRSAYFEVSTLSSCLLPGGSSPKGMLAKDD